MKFHNNFFTIILSTFLMASCAATQKQGGEVIYDDNLVVDRSRLQTLDKEIYSWKRYDLPENGKGMSFLSKGLMLPTAYDVMVIPGNATDNNQVLMAIKDSVNKEAGVSDANIIEEEIIGLSLSYYKKTVLNGSKVMTKNILFVHQKNLVHMYSTITVSEELDWADGGYKNLANMALKNIVKSIKLKSI